MEIWLRDALLDHQRDQKIERETAGKRWAEHGLVFPSPAAGLGVARWSR
ncbi:hypothetical protein [Micromonospora sp. IBSANI012]